MGPFQRAPLYTNFEQGDQFGANVHHSLDVRARRCTSCPFWSGVIVAGSLMYTRARYVLSARYLAQLPADVGWEAAFAGRSNSGKSSALNAITGQKALARTSKTPGRTQMINLFDIDPQRRLVDLPGYGYAKVPERLRREWGRTLERYLSQRNCLLGLILVMDARHPLTGLDAKMLQWCAARRLPVHALLTKCDKLGRGRAASTLLGVRKNIAAEHAGASVQLFSSPEGRGVEEARSLLDRWFGRSETS